MKKLFKKNKPQPLQNQKESHLKNLIVLTMADGHMAEIENHSLISIAHRLGFDEKDIERIKSNLDNIEFVMPDKYDEKIEQFKDLLWLMVVDGHIDPEEESICREIAKKFELTHVVVEQMLAKYS
ncbi:MAG: TerB family tellurite resistance protein [Cyclobacteriaceae bacterium]|nr:TerB family tellurite resistance protein [Cyclobacteriaceae bacterium]